jgi:hypothetical protein
MQSPLISFYLLHEIGFSRNHHLSSSRGSRSTLVGDKISNGEVNLVAYRRDHRNGRGSNGPGYRFFVKRAQVLPRASSTANDDDFHLVMQIEVVDPGGDLLRRTYPLYFGWSDDNVQIGEAAKKDGEDVTDGCTGKRGNYSYSPREEG